MIRVKVETPHISVNTPQKSIEVDNSNVKVVTGAVFTPYVDNESNLSWSNNGGLTNPPTRNIRGKDGEANITALSNFDIEAIMEG